MSKDKPQPIINNAKKTSYYKEGVEAYAKSFSRDANPYEPRSYKYTEWDRGWFTVHMKGRPLV